MTSAKPRTGESARPTAPLTEEGCAPRRQRARTARRPRPASFPSGATARPQGRAVCSSSTCGPGARREKSRSRAGRPANLSVELSAAGTLLSYAEAAGCQAVERACNSLLLISHHLNTLSSGVHELYSAVHPLCLPAPVACALFVSLGLNADPASVMTVAAELRRILCDPIRVTSTGRKRRGQG